MDAYLALPRFKEEQQFRQWWIWAILIVCFLIPIVSIVFFLNREPGENNMITVWVVTTSSLIMGFLLLFFWYLKLKTEVDPYRIYIHFYPFVTTKSYQWEDIEYAELVDYGFVGGWGVRMFTKYGTLYNVSGKMGLAFKLKNGKKICVGTQRPEELRKILAKIPAEWEEMARPWGKEKIRNSP